MSKKSTVKKPLVKPASKPAKNAKNVLINFNVTTQERDIIYRKAVKFTKGNVKALFKLRMVKGQLLPTKLDLDKIRPSIKNV